MSENQDQRPRNLQVPSSIGVLILVAYIRTGWIRFHSLPEVILARVGAGTKKFWLYKNSQKNEQLQNAVRIFWR